MFGVRIHVPYMSISGLEPLFPGSNVLPTASAILLHKVLAELLAIIPSRDRNVQYHFKQ